MMRTLNLDRHIPADFLQETIAHVLITKAKEFNPSIDGNPILVAAGPPGTGKTTCLEAIAKGMGCKVYMVHGKDLVSDMEGKASEPLIKALLEASKDNFSFVPIVLIDDAELGGLGSDPSTTGTVNGEAVKGDVMSFADKGTVRTSDGSGPPRVTKLARQPAMWMTTNRLTHIHEPILRHKRSTIVELNPKGEDLQRVISAIFPRLGMRNAGLLMRKFEDESIAFFAALKGHLTKSTAVSMVYQTDYPVDRIDWPKFADMLKTYADGASYHQLVTAGRAMQKTERDKNYLRPAQTPSINGSTSSLSDEAFQVDLTV